MSEDITPALLRAARALAGWTRGELAEAAGTQEAMIASLEDASAPADEAITADVIEALSLAGIEFIPADSKGPGVRLLPKLAGWTIDLANRRMIGERGQVWLAFYAELGRFVLNGRFKTLSDDGDRDILDEARLVLEEYYKANPGIVR